MAPEYLTGHVSLVAALLKAAERASRTSKGDYGPAIEESRPTQTQVGNVDVDTIHDLCVNDSIHACQDDRRAGAMRWPGVGGVPMVNNRAPSP